MPNPWHDEIGRFAPKGTGTQSGGATPQHGQDVAKIPSSARGMPDQAKLRHLLDDLPRQVDGVLPDQSPTIREKIKSKVRELVDKFMEGLDEDLGGKNWDPIGLVPYSEKRDPQSWAQAVSDFSRSSSA